MADTRRLGRRALGRAGSSPAFRTRSLLSLALLLAGVQAALGQSLSMLARDG